MNTLNHVRRFWESHVNNEYYTRRSRGSVEYFREISERRYHHHYHLVELFSRMQERPGKKLLEIGCGIGIDSVSLARRGFSVTACDLTASALAIGAARAREEQQDIRFLQSDAEHLPLAENSFDQVYSFGVIHHTPDMQKAIAEIRRVLRSGGCAWIMIYARYSLVNAIHKIFNLPFESPKNLQDHCPVVIRSSIAEVKRLCSGFSSVIIRKEYPFTYGMRSISALFPIATKKLIGRFAGWHLMIEAIKA
jgi:ubiquinone/menaquinone biosynthesis C-methylase UbiE